MVEFDFGKLTRPTGSVLSYDPIEVFKSASSFEDTPNDLWRGQSKALENWHEQREKNDVLGAMPKSW